MLQFSAGSPYKFTQCPLSIFDIRIFPLTIQEPSIPSSLLQYIIYIAYAAARVIKKISSSDNNYDGVLGVTSVDDELFVLLERDDNQVAVYSINDYRQLRHLTLSEFEPDEDSDMTSCVRHRCLYMSDNDNSCIHRYDLSSKLSAKIKRVVRIDKRVRKWSVPGYPCGLSVTSSCNLLVTCQGEDNKLVELSADNGQCVREIALQSDVEHPWHSVQLTTGQLVVCHGFYDDHFHRVCVVGDDGKATCSYGGLILNRPTHLAVDNDSQSIFVGDDNNDRVVLLSSTLEFVHEVNENISHPRRLYFHQATRRLFVGQWDGGVTVIQL